MIATRRLKLLSLALLMSGSAAFATQQWVQGAVRQAAIQAQAGAPAAAPVAAVRVLVAARRLPAGAVLTAGDVRWQAWPQGETASYLTAERTRLEQVAGSVVRTPLTAGQPLTVGGVARPGDRGVLATVLEPGRRAVSVNVTASSGVAGFVMPGDRVDLILSRLVEQGAQQRRFVSETVLKDVRVLGVDQRAANGKNEVLIPQTVTLEVSPQGAEVIAVIAELGKLSLSLRSLADPDAALAPRPAVTRTWDMEAVQAAPPRQSARAPGAAPRPQRTPAVEVIRGSQSSQEGSAQ